MSRINESRPPKPIAQTPLPPGPTGASKASATKAVGPTGKTDPASVATKAAADFYAAFGSRDAQSMEKLYDSNVKFHDPLFGSLKGSFQVMEMWKTILPAANPATFKIEPTVAPNPTQNADGSYNVKVHWDAHYDLGKRHIENQSDTTLVIKDGKIISQQDDWDLAKWTRQAAPKLNPSIVSAVAHSFIEVKSFIDLFKAR